MPSHPRTWSGVIAGVDGMYSGCDREWFRPVCVGDTLTYRVMCPAENKVMPSKYAGRKVLSYEKVDYYRQGGELVADTAVMNNGSM